MLRLLEQKPHIIDGQSSHAGRVPTNRSIKHQLFLLLKLENPFLDGVLYDKAGGEYRPSKTP